MGRACLCSHLSRRHDEGRFPRAPISHRPPPPLPWLLGTLSETVALVRGGRCPPRSASLPFAGPMRRWVLPRDVRGRPRRDSGTRPSGPSFTGTDGRRARQAHPDPSVRGSGSRWPRLRGRCKRGLSPRALQHGGPTAAPTREDTRPLVHLVCVASLP